ncbi:MAG TPA: LLM class F420-dependent oxidoreductase [Anaerolineales bacterium]|nr:LLM class F420-dependent oxidoreductase [Anaerolineales bacterium]
MRMGVVFPQTEFPPDPIAIRDYAQTVEGLGFTHLLVYEHVLGANPERPGGWQGPYTYQHSFYEPFVLFSYLAALTQRLEFVTGILILPQRQTTLVAKQAATLDVLCGGRLRLGIGIGWNAVEYTALGENFRNRGRRIEEQVALLRQLWTQPLVNFEGKWHQVPDAGLNPLPVQQPIPLWFGGQAEEVLRRTARLGDGWMPNYRQVEQARPALDLLRRSLDEYGRDPASFGLEPRLNYSLGGPMEWMVMIQAWQAVGATHMSVNTMGCGFSTPAAHLEALRKFAQVCPIK